MAARRESFVRAERRALASALCPAADRRCRRVRHADWREGTGDIPGLSGTDQQGTGRSAGSYGGVQRLRYQRMALVEHIPDLVPVADLRGEIYARDHLVDYSARWPRKTRVAGLCRDAQTRRLRSSARTPSLADALLHRCGGQPWLRPTSFVLLRSDGP